jgi:spermidine/putrescine transport system ATP-binding protein
MAADALVRLAGASKRFGAVVALDGVDLDIAAGEFLTLLGPSGCGKTTSLRVIAGFETPSEGRVLLDGRDVTALRPYDRPVNTVFQDYALFPHMNVEENVGFGLSVRRIAGAERKRRVADALAMVGLRDKTGAQVGELSGGQRQRVALARAIVCEPRVLLLDEPLSALDAHLREQMQVELKRLQSTLGTTFVMVTHDQTEALSISDRIVVMNEGRIEQVAAPATLYDRPGTKFVASFIGTMNLFDARLSAGAGSGSTFLVGDLPLNVPHENTRRLSANAVATIGVRPEDLAAEGNAQPGSARARVLSVTFHGRALRLHAQLEGGAKLVVDQPRQADGRAIAANDIVHVRLRPGAACVVLTG